MSRNARGTRRRSLEDDTGVSTLPIIALFVILVSFLVAAASSATISSHPVDLPSMAVTGGGAGEGGGRYLLVVHMLPDGFVVRDTQVEGVRARVAGRDEVALRALSGALAEVRNERPDHRNVILIPDPEARYDEVIEVADRVRRGGFTHLSLASASPGRLSSATPGDLP